MTKINVSLAVLLCQLSFIAIIFTTLVNIQVESFQKENISPTDNTIIVNASDLGLILGFPGWTFTGKQFWMFHGIPYAYNTAGANRFKPSVLKDVELASVPGGVFNAINPLIMCPQSDLLRFMNKKQENESVSDEINVLDVLQAERASKMSKRQNNNKREAIEPLAWGTEDCLVLNIFTKNIHKDSSIEDPLVPVLFYIHGGSSDSAWGGPFGGLRLLDEPIVLVSINYRLGILGSLNLGINEAPGNAAMYDSVTALRWVNKYIHHFGGDPNRVTISGHSAGSMMVTHLLLSPMASGLFHGVIGMSGSSLSSWATATHPSIHHHLHVSKYAGCYDGPTDLEDINLDEIDLNLIIQCMRQVSVQNLINAVDSHSDEQQYLGLGMGYDDKVPSIQSPNLTNMEIFLAKSPFEIVANQEQANVPLLMGAMRHDGTMALEKTYYDYLVPNNKVQDELFLKNELIPKICDLMGIQDRTEALYHSLAQSYMGINKNSGNFSNMLPGLIDIHSVFAFKSGAYNLVEKHSLLNNSSFYFSFDYDGLFTIYNPDSDIPGGIAHVDDILYLFFGGIMIVPQDKIVADRYVKYWINFIYNGDPNDPESPDDWPRYSPINHPFRSINADDTTLYWARDSWIGPGYEIVANDDSPTTTTATSSTESSCSSETTTNDSNSIMVGKFTIILGIFISYNVFSITFQSLKTIQLFS